MKIFVTKYCLTKGILEYEAEQSTSAPNMVCVKNSGELAQADRNDRENQFLNEPH